ncbi:MAG: hypothetical protein AB1791_19710 [Chloroflexota bacterium]
MKRLGSYVRIASLLVVLVAGVWLLGRPGTLMPESQLAREAQADRLGLTGVERLRYTAEPGEEPASEGDMLLSMGDYWATRITYPTGQFDQRWLLAAREQDRQVERRIPAGQVTYSRLENPSPLALDPNQFTSLGPAPLQSDGCWSCYNYGHVAGRTNVMVIDPVETNVAYLGSDGGGVWKTTNCCNSATTWSPVTDDPLISTIAIGDLVIDPSDHNTVYAGTGDLRYGSFSFGAAGVLKSTDQGASWTVLGADVFAPNYPEPPGEFPQYQAIGKVRVDPRNSDNVIVGTKTGVYFSYDAGDTWTGPCLTNSFTDQRQDITGLLVNDNGTSTDLYAAVGTRGFSTTVQYDLDQNGANGVYKTTVPAAGCPASWTLLNSGWPAGTGGGVPYPTNTLGRIDLAMAPSNPNVIYAQVASIPTRGQLGVWRTTDGGTTWTQRSSVTGLQGCFGDWGQNWYDQGLAVDPNNSDVVFMSTVDIFKSTNGGTTFNNLTCGYAGGTTVHVDQHALAFLPGSSTTLLAGSDGGAYVTNNANASNPTWYRLNDSLSTIEFYAGDITANFATSAAPGINAGAQDNGSSVYVWSGDPGPALWQMRNGGDGMFARIEPVNELRWYQESQTGYLNVSTTGPYGPLFSATGGWTADTRSFIFPYEMYKYDCPPTGCQHMIAGSNRVWETIQGGIPTSSWLINSLNLTKQTLADRSFINQLAYSVTDSSIAIVGTNDGNVQYGFGLGQGIANSATWVNVTGGNTILPNRPILDVATDPVIPTIGYAAVGGFDQNTPDQPGHVFQVTCNSDCSSFTWANKSGNLPNIPVDSIIANPNYPSQVFAGTDWGLYYTDDITVETPIWYRFQAGLPNVMIWDMSIDMGFTTLALFTRSRGAYAWPLPAGPINPVDYGATLGPDSALEGTPGTSVIHTFTLRNVGLNDDSYTLAVSGNSWDTTLLTSSPISVSAGLTATVSVQVDIPDAPNTADSFTLTATSTHEPGVSVTAGGTTTAVVNPAVTTSGDQSASGTMGQMVTYVITVTNAGDYVDTFDVEIGPSAWNTTSSASSVGPLDPGESGTVEIYVVVGDGDADSVTITFRSQLDTNVIATVLLTTTREGVVLYLPVIRRP